MRRITAEETQAWRRVVAMRDEREAAIGRAEAAEAQLAARGPVGIGEAEYLEAVHRATTAEREAKRLTALLAVSNDEVIAEVNAIAAGIDPKRIRAERDAAIARAEAAEAQRDAAVEALGWSCRDSEGTWWLPTERSEQIAALLSDLAAAAEARDAEVGARALREAADEMEYDTHPEPLTDEVIAIYRAGVAGCLAAWLNARADGIHPGAERHENRRSGKCSSSTVARCALDEGHRGDYHAGNGTRWAWDGDPSLDGNWQSDVDRGGADT